MLQSRLARMAPQGACRMAGKDTEPPTRRSRVSP